MRRVVGIAVLLAAGAGVACSVGEQVDTDIPVVTILSPTAGSTTGGVVPFVARALDGFGIRVVRFYVDGTQIFEDFSDPYSTTWQTSAVSNGSHTLKVEAEDFSANKGSHQITVTVDNTKQ